MTTENKFKLFKTVVRPIQTYAAKTKSNTKKTKQKDKIVMWNEYRTITGLTLRSKRTNKCIREEGKVQNLNKWITTRRKKGNETAK